MSGIRSTIIGLALLLSCCALAFALSSPTAAAAQIDAALASVSVAPANPDRAVYPLPSTLDLFLPTWRAALQDVLERTAVFRPDAPRRLSLDIRVLEFALSGRILDVLARYQLFDAATGSLVFSADISSDQGMSGLAVGVTSLEDPGVATSHRTEVNRAIEANIVQFLDQLEAFARSQSSPAPSAR